MLVKFKIQKFVNLLCYNILNKNLEVQMLRSILAYNFTPERLQMLKMVALLCKAQVKAVAREDMLQPVGYLAGIKGISSVASSPVYFSSTGAMPLIPAM